MLGPLMPGLESRWHMGDERAGLLFSAQGVASVVVALFAGPIAQRFGFAAMVTPGLLLMAAGVAGLAFASSWSIAMFCAAAIGSGLGLAIPAGNLGTAALDESKAPRQLMILNLTWCTGALIAPLCIQQFGVAFLYSLVAALAAVAAFALSAPRLRRDGSDPAPVAATRAIKIAALITSLLVFFYVGVENSVSGWISTLALRSSSAGALWAVLPSVFWLAMFTGRGVAPLVLKRLSAAQLATVGICVALAGALLLLAGNSREAYVAAGALCGIGLAPVFPAVIAQFAPIAGRSSISGVVFASANLGGAVIPYAIGAMSARSGTLRWSLALLLPLFALMLLLQARLSKVTG